MRGHVTLGDYVAFTTYLVMLVWPMIALGWVINLFQRGAASMTRIQQILDTSGRRSPTPPTPRSCRRAQGGRRVEFRDVWFRYPVPRRGGQPRRPPSDVGHSVGTAAGCSRTSRSPREPGQWVAVVGRDRRRQDHGGRAGAAADGPRPRRGAARRRAAAGAAPRRAAARHRLRPAGDVPLLPDHRREHRDGRGRTTTPSRPRRAWRSSTRPSRPSPSGYDTMLGERGHQPLGRAEAAHGHRPGAGPRPRRRRARRRAVGGGHRTPRRRSCGG